MRVGDSAGNGYSSVMHKHVKFVDDLAGGLDLVGVGQVQRKRGGVEAVRDGVEPVGGPAGEEQRMRR